MFIKYIFVLLLATVVFFYITFDLIFQYFNIMMTKLQWITCSGLMQPPFNGNFVKINYYNKYYYYFFLIFFFIYIYIFFLTMLSA